MFLKSVYDRFLHMCRPADSSLQFYLIIWKTQIADVYTLLLEEVHRFLRTYILFLCFVFICKWWQQLGLSDFISGMGGGGGGDEGGNDPKRFNTIGRILLV